MSNMQFWADKKVLITGASGFVGSHFLRVLSSAAALTIGTSLNNVDEKTYRTNLLHLEELTKLCEKFNFNVLVHCAALDGNSDFKSKNLVRVMDENISMARNIFTACSLTGIKDIVLVSSAEVYANEAGSPITEDSDYRKHFNNSGSGYAYAKIFSEIMAKMYSQQYGINIFIVRPTNIYGPNDNFSGSVSKVIPSMIRNALLDNPIEIWGDGTQVRDFIFVEDMVRVVLNMVSENRIDLLNISTGQTSTILELAEMIISLSGSRSEIKLFKNRPTGVHSRVLDTSTVSGFIDFCPTNLIDGLRETVTWFRARGS